MKTYSQQPNDELNWVPQPIRGHEGGTDEQGIASALFSTSRVIGQALSVALAGTIFTGFGEAATGVLLSSQGQNLSTSGVSDLQNTFLAGFHAAFIVCAAFAAIGIFT